MATRNARPSLITLTMPEWLAGGIEFSVRPTRGTPGRQEQAAIEALAAELGAVLPNTFVQRRYTTIGIQPRWNDPFDTAERIAHAVRIENALAERINGRIIGLADWAARPLLGRRTFSDTLAERQAAYHVVQAVRAPILDPYLAGERKVRGLEAFRTFHTALDVVSDEIVRTTHRGGSYMPGPTRPSSTTYDEATLDAAVNHLVNVELAIIAPHRPRSTTPPTYGSAVTYYASASIELTPEIAQMHIDDLLRAH